MRNPYSGPDFTNAEIRIGEELWYGNVEIHVRSSDWIKHGHSNDDSYNSIILHVVYLEDIELTELTFRKVPTLELQNSIHKEFLQKHHLLVNSNQVIACKHDLKQIEAMPWRSWLDRLSVERLERKQLEILNVLDSVQGDWNQTFLITLARSFGFKVNSDPLEQIMRQISMRILVNSNIEALLFGLSGLVPISSNDYYVQQLIKRGETELAKWQLEPINPSSWKRGGVRPSNLPEIRVAQLSALLAKHRHDLLPNILDRSSLQELYDYFRSAPDKFWEEHYSFKRISKLHTSCLSLNSIKVIVVNTVIPMLFTYGKSTAKPIYCERAIELLESIGPESNSKIEKWQNLGVNPQSAGDSQALLELYNEYCSMKKCLFCSIGKAILK